MNFSVAAVSAFNAVTGGALELVGAAFSIGGSVGPAVARLLAPHFVRHVGAVRIAVASPLGRQTGAIAASVLRRGTGSSQQGGTVSFVGSSVAIRISIADPNLRNAIAVVGAPERTRRTIPVVFYTNKPQRASYIFINRTLLLLLLFLYIMTKNATRKRMKKKEKGVCKKKDDDDEEFVFFPPFQVRIDRVKRGEECDPVRRAVSIVEIPRLPSSPSSWLVNCAYTMPTAGTHCLLGVGGWRIALVSPRFECAVGRERRRMCWSDNGGGVARSISNTWVYPTTISTSISRLLGTHTAENAAMSHRIRPAPAGPAAAAVLDSFISSGVS